MINALPEVKVVVIRMDKVPYVDQSGLYAMEDAIMDLHKQDILVVFTDIHGQPLDMFERINMIPGLISKDYNFETFEDCSQWLKKYLKSNGTPVPPVNVAFSS